MADRAKANIRVIFALTLVHFTGDFYGSFISPLLPLFADTFALSMTQVGLLAGVSRFLMFIVQPVSGYLADHYHTRLFVLVGHSLFDATDFLERHAISVCRSAAQDY